MGNKPVSLNHPAEKHASAIAALKGSDDDMKLPYLRNVIKAVNSSQGYSTTAPINLYGISTSEYCIIPCPERDDVALYIIQYLQGSNYYACRYRLSASLEKPDAYVYGLVVCWDPRVLKKSIIPRYYATSEGIIVPCGSCARQKEGTQAACTGCDVLRLWLPGVKLMDKMGMPCKSCSRAKKPRGRGNCDGCPAKSLWEARHGTEEEEIAPPAPAAVAQVEDELPALMSAEEKAKQSAQARKSGDGQKPSPKDFGPRSKK